MSTDVVSLVSRREPHGDEEDVALTIVNARISSQWYNDRAMGRFESSDSQQCGAGGLVGKLLKFQ